MGISTFLKQLNYAISGIIFWPVLLKFEIKFTQNKLQDFKKKLKKGIINKIFNTTEYEEYTRYSEKIYYV